MPGLRALFLLAVLIQGAVARRNPSQKSLLADAEQDPGHRVLFLATHHENGSYTLPAQFGQMSQTQQGTRAEGSSGISAAMQEVLDLHNKYRCMHNVPLMSWDETIAANAQAYADAGHYGHSSQAARTLRNIGYVGENLAWGYPRRTGRNSVEAWYDEIIYTDGTPESCSDKNPGDENEQICHYTQVVWKSATRLGCGKGKAEVEYPGKTYDGDFWVCQYGGGGNMRGQFTHNVLAPVKTADDCEDTPPAPAPAPGPGPAPPADSNCVDGGPNDNPIINGGAACSDVAWACESYDFVRDKCKKTCNSC